MESSLVGRVEQVDASEKGLDRIRHAKAGGKIVHDPRPVFPSEHALVQQRPDELLGKEGITLRPFDNDAAEPRGKRGRNELVHEPAGLGRRKRIESEQRPVALPAGMIVDELRASSDQEQQWPEAAASPLARMSSRSCSAQCASSTSTTASTRDEFAEKAAQAS